MNNTWNRIWYLFTSTSQIFAGIIFVYFTSKFIAPLEFGKLAIYLSTIALVEIIVVDINIFGVYRTDREAYFFGRIITRIIILTLLLIVPLVWFYQLDYALLLILLWLKPIYIYFDAISVKTKTTRNFFYIDLITLITSHVYVYIQLNESSSSTLLILGLVVRYSLFITIMFLISGVDVRLYFKQRFISRMALVNFASILKLKMDYIAISLVYGQSILGFYSKGYQINSYANQTLGKMLFYFGLKDDNSVGLRTILVILISGLLFSIFLSVYSDDIVKLVLGPGWEETGHYMSKLVFIIPFALLTKALGADWLKQNQLKEMMLFNLIHGLLIFGIFSGIFDFDFAILLLILSHAIACIILYYNRLTD